MEKLRLLNVCARRALFLAQFVNALHSLMIKVKTDYNWKGEKGSFTFLKLHLVLYVLMLSKQAWNDTLHS